MTLSLEREAWRSSLLAYVVIHRSLNTCWFYSVYDIFLLIHRAIRLRNASPKITIVIEILLGSIRHESDSHEPRSSTMLVVNGRPDEKNFNPLQ